MFIGSPWLLLLFGRRLALTRLFVRHFPTLCLSRSLCFLRCSPFLSLGTTFYLFQSFRLSRLSSPALPLAALSLSSPASPPRRLPFPRARPFTSVVNPELVTSWSARDSQAAAFNKAAARAPLIGAARGAHPVGCGVFLISE